MCSIDMPEAAATSSAVAPERILVWISRGESGDGGHLGAVGPGCTSQRTAQRFIDGQRKAVAILAAQVQAFTVLVDAHQSELTHDYPPQTVVYWVKLCHLWAQLPKICLGVARIGFMIFPWSGVQPLTNVVKNGWKSLFSARNP